MAYSTLRTRIALRNDTTAKWALSTEVLLKGEFAYDSDLKVFKVGDGVHTYSELGDKFISESEIKSLIAAIPQYEGPMVYELTLGEHTHDAATMLATLVVQVSTPKGGDIGIVKNPIDTNHFEYTAFVYDKTARAWAAMDGNYCADNVYFKDNLTYTANIGVLTVPASGSGTIESRGKNIKNVLDTILAKEKNPSTTQPSYSISLSNAGAKEVGTKVSPAYTGSFNAGSYTYGPATGCTATYSVTNGSETLTTKDGTFSEITVGDDTNYSVTGTCTYTAGAIPVTNLGNEYAAGKINAGSLSRTTSKITGYRAWFCGYKANGTANPTSQDDMTSAFVRALGTSQNGSFPSTMNTNQMQQMYFAAPTGRVSKIAVSNAVNGAPLTVTKASFTVNVEGANGYTAQAYDLFYVSNAVAEGGASKWNITVIKA